MAKIISTFSRIAMLDTDGVVIAYVRIEADSTIKIVRDINRASKWVQGDAEQHCDQMNEWSHCVLEYKVMDYEVVQVERRVKPRRQPEVVQIERRVKPRRQPEEIV